MTDLNKALKKLKGSSTPLTRKRARRLFRSAVDKVFKAYPLIGKDGRDKFPKVCTVQCPLCKIPCKNYASLASHLNRMHMGQDESHSRIVSSKVCPCCRARTNVPAHLAGLHRAGKLLQHCVMGASKAAFGENGQP